MHDKIMHNPKICFEFRAGAQPAWAQLHFMGAIFMKFHLMTSSCLFNRGATFLQTSQIKFSSQHFRKIRTFQF